MQFTLESPDYEVAGHHGQQVLIQGYQSIGVSGAPKLPMASFWVVLPPDIKPETLSLSVLSRRTDRLAVPLDLAPVPPIPADPVLNEDSVKQWYFPEISKTYDYGLLSTSGNGYVIFTTDAIKSALYDPASGVLKTFASHKLSLGYAVYLVTESQAITHSSGLSDPGFGSDTGQHRAVNIRTWLAANHGASEKNIKYALFIGNPDPDDPTNGSDTFAELSGDWELDRDGLYGEFNGDNGTGGVEFLPEVYVGRIPFSDTSRISGILQKTMDYENVTFSATDNSALAWRKKTLLPMSILNFGTSMWGGDALEMDRRLQMKPILEGHQRSTCCIQTDLTPL